MAAALGPLPQQFLTPGADRLPLPMRKAQGSRRRAQGSGRRSAPAGVYTAIAVHVRSDMLGLVEIRRSSTLHQNLTCLDRCWGWSRFAAQVHSSQSM